MALNVKPLQNPAEDKRRNQIEEARNVEIDKLRAANSTALQNAKKQKGSQKYTYQALQGQTDFGAGQGGPGVPWSVQNLSLPESQAAPKGNIPGIPWGWQKGSQAPSWASTLGKLWGTPGNVNAKDPWSDPKLLAIRRRLNNG